ncbi:MoaD/ThiS family protein [Microlunatus soli]|uniref:ThiS family protein n=1 Tax=Microlunatus soli TaxID=630515 RepID=A0A1H1S4P9_9ACTN|nr:MoaD/ThiS family protein [Microlunatus soli]SDS42972.1 ThiS family protein [Microlunatus soli]
MTNVVLHYWAGARAAAGVETEVLQAPTIAAAVAAAGAGREDSRLADVLVSCSFLIDGRVLHEQDQQRPLDSDVTVEVLPPFAGGRR